MSNSVLVWSVQLIFSDEDIHLSVGVIYAFGHMRIGGEGCRVLSQITITFHNVTGQNVHSPDLGIVVEESGQLDMHGEKFSPTWTRLISTAKEGEDYASLKVKLSQQICSCLACLVSIHDEVLLVWDSILVFHGLVETLPGSFMINISRSR